MRIRIFLLSVLSIMVLMANAQAPKQINYQAVIRDASGAPVTNKAIGIKFRSMQMPPTAVWSIAKPNR